MKTKKFNYALCAAIVAAGFLCVKTAYNAGKQSYKYDHPTTQQAKK